MDERGLFFKYAFCSSSRNGEPYLDWTSGPEPPEVEGGFAKPKGYIGEEDQLGQISAINSHVSRPPNLSPPMTSTPTENRLIRNGQVEKSPHDSEHNCSIELDTSLGEMLTLEESHPALEPVEIVKKDGRCWLRFLVQVEKVENAHTAICVIVQAQRVLEAKLRLYAPSNAVYSTLEKVNFSKLTLHQLVLVQHEGGLHRGLIEDICDDDAIFVEFVDRLGGIRTTHAFVCPEELCKAASFALIRLTLDDLGASLRDNNRTIYGNTTNSLKKGMKCAVLCHTIRGNHVFGILG